MFTWSMEVGENGRFHSSSSDIGQHHQQQQQKELHLHEITSAAARSTSVDGEEENIHHHQSESRRGSSIESLSPKPKELLFPRCTGVQRWVCLAVCVCVVSVTVTSVCLVVGISQDVAGLQDRVSSLDTRTRTLCEYL